MPHFTPAQWMLAVVAAMGMGVGKAGFAGVGMFHVLVFAFLFGARDSTGVVLPMLVAGDICAVAAFRQQARWEYVRRMLPPACIGIVVSAALMSRISDATFKPLIGWIILGLAVLQIARMQWPDRLSHVPHSPWFAWTMGLLAGATTMLANAAGPIIVLYALAVALPKLEFVGTNAWFFLIINAFKVPFSVGLGLIHAQTLLFNLALVPPLVIGLLLGRWMLYRVPQKLFDGLLLAFAVLAALRLIQT